jgi:hypothetical protein
VSFPNEYDYTSIGFGGGFTKLFNQKKHGDKLEAPMALINGGHLSNRIT